MQAALSQDPRHGSNRSHPDRLWRVTGAVVLAHGVVAWTIGSATLSPAVPMGAQDVVIMASVVMDAPAPPARKPEALPPRAPAQTQTQATVQPKPPSPKTPNPQAFSPEIHPTPALAQAAPSEAAPVVPAAAPSSPQTPPMAAGKPSVSAAAKATASATASVVLPSTNADYLNNPAPPYPRVSKRLGEQGTVLIRVFINTEGRAEKAEIRTSSGYARLDDTALNTVQAWRFVPGQRNGVPEAMWFNVPIRFVLD